MPPQHFLNLILSLIGLSQAPYHRRPAEQGIAAGSGED